MNHAEPEEEEGNDFFEMRPVDLDERRRVALDRIDNARFSWYHVKVCLVAGTGFFADAYDIFAINVASVMLGYVYGTDRVNAKLSSQQDLALKVANPVGTLCGQLFFGWLADVVGRKRMYGLELMIIIVATFGQALSGPASALSIIGVLFVWRFLQGLGIGGDYPMSAVISAEFAATRLRGRLMTATFAAQGFGTCAAALVALIVVSAYKDSIIDDNSNIVAVDSTWRLLIGFGCVPAVVALLFRLTISETPRFTMDVERNIRRATEDINEIIRDAEQVEDVEPIVRRAVVPEASWADFKRHFGRWRNMKVLIGTSWSWFALDVAFYGLGLNTSTILQVIGFKTTTNDGNEGVFDNLMNNATGNLIISVAGLIPGYWVSFIFIDSWGRKPIQLMGFTMLTILFVIMGFAYDKLTATPAATKAFVFLYCLTNFFQNFGPNTTTFVIPGEVFPTRYRSTAHGISAASGKLGAIVSQFGFIKLKDIGGTDKSIKHVLEIFALFTLTGIASTLLIPETNQRTLEELSNEDQNGFVRN